VPEWFEVFFDELWSELFDRALDPPQLEERARAIQRLVAAGEGDAVLDLPCGLGRLTVPLARLGLRMTGVDLSPAYLDRGRDRAAAAGLAIRFIQSHMREIGFQGEFDAAFNWGGSFGYFSEEDNLRYCRRVREALKPGGRFLIEAANQAWLAENCHPRTELVAWRRPPPPGQPLRPPHRPLPRHLDIHHRQHDAPPPPVDAHLRPRRAARTPAPRRLQPGPLPRRPAPHRAPRRLLSPDDRGGDPARSRRLASDSRRGEPLAGRGADHYAVVTVQRPSSHADMEAAIEWNP